MGVITRDGKDYDIDINNYTFRLVVLSSSYSMGMTLFNTDNNSYSLCWSDLSSEYGYIADTLAEVFSRYREFVYYVANYSLGDTVHFIKYQIRCITSYSRYKNLLLDDSHILHDVLKYIYSFKSFCSDNNIGEVYIDFTKSFSRDVLTHLISAKKIRMDCQEDCAFTESSVYTDWLSHMNQVTKELDRLLRGLYPVYVDFMMNKKVRDALLQRSSDGFISSVYHSDIANQVVMTSKLTNELRIRDIEIDLSCEYTNGSFEFNFRNVKDKQDINTILNVLETMAYVHDQIISYFRNDIRDYKDSHRTDRGSAIGTLHGYLFMNVDTGLCDIMGDLGKVVESGKIDRINQSKTDNCLCSVYVDECGIDSSISDWYVFVVISLNQFMRKMMATRVFDFGLYPIYISHALVEYCRYY